MGGLDAEGVVCRCFDVSVGLSSGFVSREHAGGRGHVHWDEWIILSDEEFRHECGGCEPVRRAASCTCRGERIDKYGYGYGYWGKGEKTKGMDDFTHTCTTLN